MNRGEQRLRAYLLDFLPNSIGGKRITQLPLIPLVSIDSLQDGRETSLVAFVIYGFVLILLKYWVLFVDRVVGQVHEVVVQVVRSRAFILHCRKSRESFFVDEASQRRSASDQHV